MNQPLYTLDVVPPGSDSEFGASRTTRSRVLESTAAAVALTPKRRVQTTDAASASTGHPARSQTGIRASWNRAFIFFGRRAPAGWKRSPGLQGRNSTGPDRRSRSRQDISPLYT